MLASDDAAKILFTASMLFWEAAVVTSVHFKAAAVRDEALAAWRSGDGLNFDHGCHAPGLELAAAATCDVKAWFAAPLIQRRQQWRKAAIKRDVADLLWQAESKPRAPAVAAAVTQAARRVVPDAVRALMPFWSNTSEYQAALARYRKVRMPAMVSTSSTCYSLGFGAGLAC